MQAPTLAGQVVMGWSPQCLQAVMLALPVLLCSAFVIAAPVHVVGVPGHTGILVVGRLRFLIAGRPWRTALSLALSHLKVGELAVAHRGVGAAG